MKILKRSISARMRKRDFMGENGWHWAMEEELHLKGRGGCRICVSANVAFPCPGLLRGLT